MSGRLPFDRLVHSDWSVDPRKRWSATAIRDGSGWRVESVRRTPANPDLLDDLLSTRCRTLAGFDFAIGLPALYLDRIALDFLTLLSRIGTSPWHNFTRVAGQAHEISIYQPFYPNRGLKGVQRSELLNALQCESGRDLLRACERATVHRSAASPLFWTLGAKQVGKAALSGWSEIIRPALTTGAAIWPYGTDLSAATTGQLVIAETYPAEAYKHVGINLSNVMSKRCQADRKAAMISLVERCANVGVALSDQVRRNIDSGFGPGPSGEDPFDAIAGLMSMLDVADRRRPACPTTNHALQKREGWILGQTDLPAATSPVA